MEKKATIILMLLLCGCTRKEKMACIREYDDGYIDIEIEGEYNTISRISVVETLVFPEQILLDDEKLRFLLDQAVEGSYVEGNHLIRSYELCPLEDYDFRRSIDALRKERFYCE